MIVVTTPYLAGHRVVESKGMVFGLVVRSRGLGGNLMASIRSLGGGEIHEYTSLLEDTRRQALDRLVQNATLLGANAVLSMRFDSSELSGTMSEIVAYGTAVVVDARTRRAPTASGVADGSPAGRDDRPGHRRPRRHPPGRARRRAVRRPTRRSPITGLILVGLGVVLIVGALIERMRYRSGRRADAVAAPPGPGGGEPIDQPMDPRFQRTDERFVDPTTNVRDAGVDRSVERRAAVPRRGRDRRSPFGESGPFAGPCYPRPPGPVPARLSVQEPIQPPWPPSIQAHPPDPRRPRAHVGRAKAEVAAPLPQPRAVVARVQRPRPPRGARRAQPAARAGQVPGDLREQPRRVLPGPDRRPARAGRGRQRRTARRDGRTADEQLAAARERVLELVAEHSAIFLDIRRALAAEGVELLDYAAIPEHHEALRQRFLDEIFPVLTPLAVDPGHPFPYISTLSLSIAVGLRDPETGERSFARVKVPQILPRLLEVEPERFVLIDQVIEANLDALFLGMEIVEHHLFRVTRNADLAIEEDEADDLLLAIEEELRRRRFGEAVRLEVERSMPAGTRTLLLRGLGLAEADCYEVSGMLDLTGLRPDRRPRPAGPPARRRGRR